MKLSKEDLAEVIEFLDHAEDFRPIIESVIKMLLSHGPQLKLIPQAVSKFLVQQRIDSIKQYRDAGFSKMDAITMTLDAKFAVSRIASQIGNSQKNSSK